MNLITGFTIPDEDDALDEAERWTVQTDSSSAWKKGRVGVVIITLERETLKYGVQLKFSTTNNEVEY